MEIVFVNDAAPVLFGPWTDPFVARFPAGTKIVGARLHPGLAPSFLGIPAAELLNQSAPLSELWGSNGARFGLPPNDSTLVSLESILARGSRCRLRSAT